MVRLCDLLEEMWLPVVRVRVRTTQIILDQFAGETINTAGACHH